MLRHCWRSCLASRTLVASCEMTCQLLPEPAVHFVLLNRISRQSFLREPFKFALFHSILFDSILILFYSIPCYSFYSILIMFYFIYSILFYSSFYVAFVAAVAEGTLYKPFMIIIIIISVTSVVGRLSHTGVRLVFPLGPQEFGWRSGFQGSTCLQAGCSVRVVYSVITA